MDQGVRAVFEDYAVTAALVLILLAYVPWGWARPAVEGTRPVGIVEQPCAGMPSSVPTQTSSDTDRQGKDWREHLLDPGAGRENEPPPPDPSTASALHAAEEDRVHNDWAQLCRYKQENATLRRGSAGDARVVFMGDSITEFWKLAHPGFFGETYIDRGISGQTTAQMLVRFRQDVIALKPSVVHILAGTNDIAGNGGPTTLDAIKNNIISMVDLAVANDIRVVLGSIPPAGMFPWRPSVAEPAEHIVAMNEWLRRFARDRNLIYVDYHEPLADERDAMKQTFSNDGVHPNRDGYSVMEPLARHAIDQALAQAADTRSRTAPPRTRALPHK
jgi:lysophospholipase L1-like esterase